MTDGACTIPLGVEPGHPDVLKRPPRDPRAPIVDGSLLGRMAVLTPLMAAGTLILFRWALGGSTFARAQTVAFTTMAAFQWWQAFNARSHRESIFRIGWAGNRWLLLGVAAAFLLQLAAVQTGFGNTIFGTAPLAAADWGLIILVSSSILWADEIRKRIAAHRQRSRGGVE